MRAVLTKLFRQANTTCNPDNLEEGNVHPNDFRQNSYTAADIFRGLESYIEVTHCEVSRPLEHSTLYAKNVRSDSISRLLSSLSIISVNFITRERRFTCRVQWHRTLAFISQTYIACRVNGARHMSDKLAIHQDAKWTCAAHVTVRTSGRKSKHRGRVRSKSLWHWYINTNIVFVDIIHRPNCI
jgi:hypothetical protein